MSIFKNRFDEWIGDRNGKRFLNNSSDFEVFIDYKEKFGFLQSVTYRKNGCSVTYCIYMYNQFEDDFILVRLFSNKEKAKQTYNLLTTYD